jgi:hypothetical protein
MPVTSRLISLCLRVCRLRHRASHPDANVPPAPPPCSVSVSFLQRSPLRAEAKVKKLAGAKRSQTHALGRTTVPPTGRAVAAEGAYAGPAGSAGECWDGRRTRPSTPPCAPHVCTVHHPYRQTHTLLEGHGRKSAGPAVCFGRHRGLGR